jgi:hypothetical protein
MEIASQVFPTIKFRMSAGLGELLIELVGVPELPGLVPLGKMP